MRPRERDTGRAMAQENVEIVQRALHAWQGDDPGLFLSFFDPSIEWHAPLERELGGPQNCYRGIDGMRQFWSVYRNEFETSELDAQVRDVDEERVLLLGHIRFRGEISGFEGEWSLAQVITVRNGRVVHSMGYRRQIGRAH